MVNNPEYKQNLKDIMEVVSDNIRDIEPKHLKDFSNFFYMYTHFRIEKWIPIHARKWLLERINEIMMNPNL